MARPISKPTVTGTVFAGGTLVSIHHRDLRWRAVVDCHCGARYGCRLDYFESGKARSCGCLKKAAFMGYLERGVAMIDSSRAAALAEAVELAGSNGLMLVAERFKVSRAHLSVVWRNERKKAVASVPATSLDRALVVAHVQGFEQASVATGIAMWVIMAAVRIRKAVATKLAEAQAAIEATQAVVADAIEVAKAALSAAATMPGRYRREEFDARELPSRSRGTGPLWKAYRTITSSAIPSALKGLADEFVDKVEYSLRNRKERSDVFNRNRWWARQQAAFAA